MKESLAFVPGDDTQIVKAIENGTCNRCGNKNLVRNRFERLRCPICDLSEDDWLYLNERKVSHVEVRLRKDLILTERQKQASIFLSECVHNGESGSLVAVCGAGKTEMTYEAIKTAVEEDKKICFAIPRREIVRELAKRMRRDFEGVNIGEMHQNAKTDENCQIVVATIHQLINYRDEFDVLILDEVDAYPFCHNDYLSGLVKKAAKPNAVFISMSATMGINGNPSVKKQVVPERYHGHDLDLPRFIKTSDFENMLEKDLLPQPVWEKITGWLKAGKRIFLFVPTIKKGEKVLSILQKAKIESGFVHAASTTRSKVLSDFYSGKINILVTTTVMERGVTYDDVQVGVVLADHPVFAANTLIQIAGRVGRYKDHPSGEVCFFSETLTREMIDCRKEIISMNRKKRQTG